MSQHITRRAFLTTVGAGVTVGVAGCTSGETEPETTTPGAKTFGIEVTNAIEPVNFEESEELSEPQPAVVHLRVNNLDPDSDETYFEKTAEVPTSETKTFPEAFTVTYDGRTYAMSAELQPFVDGGLSGNRNRKDGVTFTPGGFGDVPSKNPIPVTIQSIDREGSQALFPVIVIDT